MKRLPKSIISRSIRLICALISVIIFSIFYTQCDGPSYSIDSFTSDKIHPNFNDRVTLKWEYSDDLNNDLESQRLEFMTASFDPAGMHTEVVPVNNNERTYQLTFKGTVVIMLVAACPDCPNGEIKACIELTPDPSNNPWYLKANVSNDGMILTGGNFIRSRYYPDLGYPPLVVGSGGGCSSSTTNISRELNFTTCFAFYDGKVNYQSDDRKRSEYNKKIDSFSNILDPNNPFFRAFTTNFNEMKVNNNYYWTPFSVGYFKKAEGSGYPLILLYDEENNTAVSSQSNVIVYGGAIVYDGTSANSYKASDGTGVTTNNVSHCMPVFIELILQFPDHFYSRENETNYTFNLLDFLIGNATQGLVAGLNYNEMKGYTGFTSFGMSWMVDGQVGGDYIKGYIKSATTAVQVMTLDGNVGISTTTVTSVDFKVPFYPDTELERFLSGSATAALKTKLLKADGEKANKCKIKGKSIKKKIKK